RPASSAATDRLIHELISSWRSEEERLGIEIDARVFAYLCKDDRSLDAALGSVGLMAPADDDSWRFGVVYSFLWPRGWAVRAQALSLYNPFAQILPTDSRLLREVLPRPAAAVSAGAGAEVDSAAVSSLIQDGVVALTARATESALLRRAILASLAS